MSVSTEIEKLEAEIERLKAVLAATPQDIDEAQAIADRAMRAMCDLLDENKQLKARIEELDAKLAEMVGAEESRDWIDDC